MADPTKYLPGYSYSDWQAINPKKPLPADEVDNDFANVSRSINETIDGLKNIRRSDGKLKNGIVGPDALSPTLSLGFTLRGPWAEGQTYEAGDGVVKDSGFYAARVSHLSTLANAPPSSNWNFLFSVDDIAVAGALAMTRTPFVGDGTTKDFTLATAPVSRLNLLVSVGGVIQSVDDYSVNGNVVSFVTAPPDDYAIEIRVFATTTDLVTPVDGSVTFAKLDLSLQTAIGKANTALQIADVVQGSGVGVKIDPASSQRIIVSASRFDPLTYSGANIREKINNAITAAKAAGGGTVVLPDGQIDLDGGIVHKSFVELLGKSATVLKMKNGISGHVLAGENADTLFASPTFNPADGANQCTLRNLKIDGNRANVPGGGAGIKIWGWQLHFENVQVANAKGNAIMTSWTDAGVPMEPTFSRVKIDTCGANGWVFTGPHDAHFDDVTIVDAGQDAHNTFAGFYNAAGGNGRFYNLHIWHRATSTNRCAVACDSFGANEYIASHFEGCVQQIKHSGNNDRLVGCFIYAPFGADDNALVTFANNDNQHVGCVYRGGTAPQNPNTFAVAFTNLAAGNMISAGRFLGFTSRAVFNFISSGGNFIEATGYAGAGAVNPIAGTPHAQDFIDYTQGGTTPYRIWKPPTLAQYANDAAAGSGGVMSGGLYVNSTTKALSVKV